MSNHAMLCIQCRDITSGRVGTFLAEPSRGVAYSAKNPLAHGFRAISPVFPDFLVLTEWCVRNGWRMVTDLDKAREYPVGFYIKEAPNED